MTLRRRGGPWVFALSILLTSWLLVGPVSTAKAAVLVDDVPSPSWGVNGRVVATAIIGDTYYVGGTFTSAVSPSGALVARKNLAAFSLTTGELVTKFRADAGSPVRALATDGVRLWVGGNFGRLGGRAASRIGQVDPVTGAVVTTFSASVDNTVRALAYSEGQLYAGGVFQNANGQPRNRLAKFDATTGALDPTFVGSADLDVWGLVENPVTDVLYVSGNFRTLSGAARNGVGAISSTTGASQAIVFGSAARPTLGLDINEDGSRLFGAGGSGSNAAAAWDTESGDRVWRQVTDGDIQAVDYYNDTVYFGFHDGYQGDQTIKMIAVDSDTGQLQSFVPRFDMFWGVFAISAGPGGVVAGGEFTRVSGVQAKNLALFSIASVPPAEPIKYSLLGATTLWSYWDQDSRPVDWESPVFDDAAWRRGLAQLGYGDGDEATVINKGSSTNRPITSYYRTEFFVDPLAPAPDLLQLMLLADDGAIVYLNGQRVVRDNMSTSDVTHTTLAATDRTGGPENAFRSFSIDPSKLLPDRNVIAVEVHQSSATTSDASFDADLIAQRNP
jgi:hypothetical protein